ncbi:hypothetical protein CEV31_0922 [Brucella thiophenivorans]|uniref:Uncharacterized protein n=1 Tax=Brucella thiophenivorans TaxID=571255 RepID=A0A256G0P6_9HYPH|nr:hypothetical protein CEV31_0922 [Brucella thiophenivorans]
MGSNIDLNELIVTDGHSHFALTRIAFHIRGATLSEFFSLTRASSHFHSVYNPNLVG